MAPSVLVVDDSAYVRQAVGQALESDGIEVVGYARDGREAVQKNRDLHPDVVILDLQMPQMDGVEALRRIRATRPVPVLVFASMSAVGAELAVAALAEGAVDILPKATNGEFGHELAARVWALTAARASDTRRAQRARRDTRLVAIAASTGGPPLIERILVELPQDFPAPVVIAQHMPAGFTGSFARRLDSIARVRVFEGSDGADVGPGEACILPGGAVSTLRAGDSPADGRLVLRSQADSLLGGARPNASALFFSAVGTVGGDLTAVVLSGMGADGSDAVPALVASGADVLAQDPAEAVLPSMPNAAVAAGARVAGDVDDIARHLAGLVRRRVEGRA